MCKRTFQLYDHECLAGMTTDTAFRGKRNYEFVTSSNELQRANDFAREKNVRHGHVAVMENGECVNKLQVGC